MKPKNIRTILTPRKQAPPIPKQKRKPDPGSQYLDVAELSKLRHYIFESRHRVSGLFVGRHRSPQLGRSVEFSDYREYFPGDPLNDIDWKAYGRSDRMFVKQFEKQAELTVNIIVDGSASMSYKGDDSERKYDHACRLAAAIAFLVINQQDKVSFSLAHNASYTMAPPRRNYNHLKQILAILGKTTPDGQADLPGAIKVMAEQTRERGILILISDLHENREQLLKALSMFVHRGNDVLVFRTLHPHEIELPDVSETLFHDSESGEEVRLNVDDIRADYKERMEKDSDTLIRALWSRKIRHHLIRTDTPYYEALERYLVTCARGA